jgi:hypothetical protein
VLQWDQQPTFKMLYSRYHPDRPNWASEYDYYVNYFEVHAQQTMDINVKCYSGYVYAQEPRSFVWQERELEIKSVEKAWHEPGKRLFRVVTQDGRLFELCYNEPTDRWSAVELI